MSGDEAAIRALVAEWGDATRREDVAGVLALMAEDVVFLVPGQPPIRGRAAFEQGLREVLAGHTIDAQADVQEVEVSGGLAWGRSELRVTVTPRDGGRPLVRAGQVLSVFRRNGEGRWQLARDANLVSNLTPVG